MTDHQKTQQRMRQDPTGAARRPDKLPEDDPSVPQPAPETPAPVDTPKEEESSSSTA